MKYKVLLLALAAITTSCSPQADINYQIIPEQPQQTMDHFSASDAWSMHIIGKWPQEKQDQVADWLFSTDNDTNGKPKGIGLCSVALQCRCRKYGTGRSQSDRLPLDAYRMFPATGRKL